MHGATLLIVEDDVDLAEALATHAAAHGYRVTTIATLAELDAIEPPVSFEAALVDLVPGTEPGLDAISRIHRAAPASEIVVISSTTSVSSAIAMYDLSAFAFVQKPFDTDQLFATLARAVDHQRVNQAHRRLVWELKLVNEVSEDLRRSLDPRVLLETVLQRLIRAMDGNSGSVRLLHPGAAEEETVFIGPPALEEAWLQGRRDFPRPSDAVVRTGKPSDVPDFAELTAGDPARLPIRSALSVPMIAGDEMIGALSVGSTRPRRFVAEDRQLIQTVTNHLAMAVQNARLHSYARAGKQQWEATFDAIGDPIAVFDSAGRLKRGNTALAAYLNRPVTSLTGMTCDEIGLCGGTFPECAVGHPVGEACGRAEVTSANGEIFSVTTCPVEGHTDGISVVQIAKNVTHEIRSARRLMHMSEELAATNERLVATVDRLKTTQAQLLQAEKLSAIGQLVAGVAHELNNPLTSVIGYAQLVEEELRQTAQRHPDVASVPGLTRDVWRIAEESERAARIVRNLLAFARRQTAARAPHDVAELTGRVLSLRAYEFRLNAIDIETAFEPNLPHVLADAGQLQQALLNLVLNAEQAMRARTPRRLQVGARYDAAAQAVEMFITDNGHGIAEENLRRVFDPFFTTREVGEGTGLGLSICYGIVRDHGGEIAVRSRVGEGTTFSIRLPAQPASPRTAAPRVLVAHGDQPERDYIAAALGGWGLRVETIDQASAALARIERGDADLALVEHAFVLTDHQGWSDARRRLAGRTSFVLLAGTAHLDGSDFDGNGGNADAILAPPFELRSLRGALRGVSRECV